MKTILIIREALGREAGLYQDDNGGYLARTYHLEKPFKTPRNALRWLADHGFNAHEAANVLSGEISIKSILAGE